MLCLQEGPPEDAGYGGREHLKCRGQFLCIPLISLKSRILILTPQKGGGFGLVNTWTIARQKRISLSLNPKGLWVSFLGIWVPLFLHYLQWIFCTLNMNPLPFFRGRRAHQSIQHPIIHPTCQELLPRSMRLNSRSVGPLFLAPVMELLLAGPPNALPHAHLPQRRQKLLMCGLM